MQPSAAHRLIVEGRDDKWSVINLMARHGIDWETPHPSAAYVSDCEGYEKLLETIIPTVKSSHRRIGILIDTDLSLQNRWNALASRLRTVGIPLPETPQPGGTIVPGITPDRRVGVWLMPDNQRSGMLEDFLAMLVPEGDPCWAYADEAVAEAARRGAQFHENHVAKARIHTWLAWQAEPGLPFGTALTCAYFRTDSLAAVGFSAWFRRLFFDEIRSESTI